MDAMLRVKAEQLAGELAEQVRTAADVQAAMRLMMKSVMERVLDVELDHHLGRRLPGLDESPAASPPAEESASSSPAKRRNRKNGHSAKTVRADLGELTIATPRDRNGTFEPLLIPKHQRQVTGFEEKILALYAKGLSTRDIQEILQELYGVEVSATLRYVAHQDSPAVVRDLKKIYHAPTALEAEQALEEFSPAWDQKYPTISQQWRAKWTDISTLFEFPWEIRRVIATTNAIESVNSVIRKLTRNRKIYPNEDSALKIVYLAIREASRKWTMPIRNWKSALNHFAILFERRLPG